jgi:hypothetical protein
MLPVFVVALAIASGCGDDDPVKPPGPLPGDQAVTDFSLPDLNPNSATHSQNVSPRQKLDAISAWYFGHST